jgi:hypothetical protein
VSLTSDPSVLVNASLSYDFSNNCGAKNCPQTKMPPSLSKPVLQSIYNLCYSLIALIVIAVIVTILFLDNIKDDETSQDVNAVSTSLSNINIYF